nr:zinc finger, CCHC-type [Tanacetum cinerariifolium]
MAEEDAFLVDDFEGGLCVDYTEARIDEDDTVEAIRRRATWENDDYICSGHILNEDASSKNFLVSNFNNYKMVDSRHVMEQFNELLRILGQYTQHGLKIDESNSVSCVIYKLPPSWKDFKHTLKHGKDDLSLVQFGCHLRIEKSLRTQDSDKGKGKEVVGPSINMTEEDESIDSVFARFSTIITSLKALDEGYSKKNYVRKFVRALHPKWRAKVKVIEVSKDLTSLSLDELIGNLKVHEIIIKKDSKIVKAKVERKSLSLKAKKESSDEECSTSKSKEEEYAMAVRDFKMFFKRRECPKPPKDKNQRSFVGGSWSDSGEEDDENINNETCLVAQASSEICLGVDLEPDEWINDSECSKHMTGNRKHFSSYKACNRGNVIFGSNLHGNIIDKGKICDNKCRVTFSEHDSESTKDGKVIDFNSDPNDKGECYSQNSKAYIILNKHTRKIKELLNVTFDETPLPSKTSPLVDDDLDEEESIKVTEKKNLKNDIVDETLKIDKIVNIKESRNHPLENVIGNLNQTTLRSQAKTKELVSQPKNVTVLGTKWVFTNKLDENGIVSRNKARLVAQGYNQQEGIDYDETYALVIRLESIRILLAYACTLDFKLFQMDVKSAFLNSSINEEGACVLTDKWSLEELAYGVLTDGPYQTNPPSPNDIISSIRIDREGQVRIRHEEEIYVLEYQILTREIVPTLKPLEEIIWENVFCLGESYVLYDRVMNPLVAQLERKTRKDRGTRRGRRSTSYSTSNQPSSSHLNDDDDDDDGNG